MTTDFCPMHRFWKCDINDRDQYAQTPDELLKKLETLYGTFDFDPCPADPNFDGLNTEWGKNNFVNPPFKYLSLWLKKSLIEWKKGKKIVFLMPIRLHTKYFIENIYPHFESGGIEAYLIKGGVKFKNYKQKAPFGMMYLLFK